MGFFQAISIIQLRFAVAELQTKIESGQPKTLILVLVSSMVAASVIFNIIISVEQNKIENLIPLPSEDYKDEECAKLYRVYGCSSSVLFLTLSIILMFAI